jgi:hypothetical protein
MGLFGDAPIAEAASDPWSLPDGTYEGAIGSIETYVPEDEAFTCTNIELVSEDGRSYTLRLYHPQDGDDDTQVQRKLSNIKRFYEGLEIPEEKMDSATAEDIQAAGERIVFTLKSNTSKKTKKTYQNLYSISLPRGTAMSQRVGDDSDNRNALSEFARATTSNPSAQNISSASDDPWA